MIFFEVSFIFSAGSHFLGVVQHCYGWSDARFEDLPAEIGEYGNEADREKQYYPKNFAFMGSQVAATDPLSQSNIPFLMVSLERVRIYM